MKLQVDKKADALYLRLDDSAIVESIEVAPGVVLDFNQAEEVDGVEDDSRLLRTARQAHVDDGMALMHEPRAEPAGLGRRDPRIGLQPVLEPLAPPQCPQPALTATAGTVAWEWPLQRGAGHMTAVPVTGADQQTAGESVTLADLDASVGESPDVPQEEVAVRYYSDEALRAAIRLRRNGRNAS